MAIREVTGERRLPDPPSALLPKEGLKHFAEGIGLPGRRTGPEVCKQPTYPSLPDTHLIARYRARALTRALGPSERRHRRRHSAQRRHLGWADLNYYLYHYAP